MVIVQIEHIDAVSNIDEIFGGRCDGFFIGPNDLSGSMGIPRQTYRKEYKDAVDRVKEAGIFHGITSGVHVVEPNIEEFDSVL